LTFNRINDFKSKLIVNPSSSGVLDRKIKNRILNNESENINDSNNNNILFNINTNNNNKNTYKNISKKLIQNELIQKSISLSRKKSPNLRGNKLPSYEINIYDNTISNNKRHKYII
jgi:hypothetical protein